MRGTIIAMLAAALLVPSPALAESEQWIVAVDLWGNTAYSTLAIDRDGERISGDLDGDRVEGAVSKRKLEFTAANAKGYPSRFTATLSGDRASGEAEMPDTNDAARRVRHAFTARRIPDRPTGGPRVIDFQPTDYSNAFDPHRTPVLTIWPGDTVRTSTIDSGGVDATGVTRALFGNPQTGPFFVAGAAPGDTLVVTIKRLALNRDWADSLDAVVGRAAGLSLAKQLDGLGKPVRWRLDRTRGTASPEGAEGALKDYAVPLRPMLGGLAVAPGFGFQPVSTGDTGNFGGNMDFNEVVEGNRVYLPVQQPGALLYLGDAHALQGDGETTQYALETSMDVEFSVDLVKGKRIAMPQVESPTEIMVLGQAGSLDDALKAANTGMIAWLRADYGMTLSQAAQVMGSAAKFSIANLAGRSVGVAAKLDKSLLPKR